MKQVFYCDDCNFNLEHLSYPGIANHAQAQAARVQLPKSIPCPNCNKGMSESLRYIRSEQTYLCSTCNAKLHYDLTKAETTETRVCPCGGDMNRIWKSSDAPNVSRVGDANAPVDVIIGKKAEEKWDVIHARQEERNKVRVSSGQYGLTAVTQDTFKPITQEQKIKRTKILTTAAASGIGVTNTTSERTLVGG
jgi:DNA-directed RNA polymerase subunit RPC12/RpoP